MSNELKPCPFCGSDAGEQNIIIVGRGLCKMVFCEKCHIDFKNPTSIEQQNHRPAEDTKDKEIERLKAKLDKVEKSLVWHRDNAVVSVLPGNRQIRKIDNSNKEFVFKFCTLLLETINAPDTNVGTMEENK